MMNKEDPLEAWNGLQPLFLGRLGRSFGELFTATSFFDKIKEIRHSES